MEITIPGGKGVGRRWGTLVAAGAMLVASGSAAEPVAFQARVIADAARLRVVVDVDGTTPYRATIAAGTNILNVDLPGTTAVQPDVCDGIRLSPAVLDCSFGRLVVGYGRIRIALSTCGTVDANRFIEPVGTEPGQILVDVVFGRPLRCSVTPS